MIQDHEIMLSVKKGDVQRLGVLFDKYSKRLFNYFQLQIKDRLKSEDLVQNVFYNILRYRHTYNEGSDFRVWMYTIARNEKIIFFRRKKKTIMEMNIEESENTNPENDLEKKADINRLNIALERVSPDNKELIILSKFNELSHSQIAETVGCTVGALKVRIFRAMKELKEQYSKTAGE